MFACSGLCARLNSSWRAAVTRRVDNVSVYHICRESIYYVLCSKTPGDSVASRAAAIELLSELHAVIKNFCGTTTEDSLRKNALLIEEILAEIINSGHIYTTDLSSLRSCIYSEPAETPAALKKTALASALLGPMQEAKPVVPNTMSLRPVFGSRLDRTKNRSNSEIFVDVVERLYTTISKEGKVINFSLNGTVNLKSCLESQTSITLGFNDDLVLASSPSESESYNTDVVLTNYILHETVRSDKFPEDRTLTVLAPQGEVPVLRYTMTTIPRNGLPFTIASAVEEVADSRDLVLTVKLRCEGSLASEAIGTTLDIPVPCGTSGLMKLFNDLDQTAEFQHENKKIVWKIKSLKSKSEAVGKFRLANANERGFGKLELGPISMKFELSNQSTSGLKIRFLKTDLKDGSNIQRWIRYVTASDCWIQRLN
ncbi:uncharacterized protein LOC144149798 isoform X2 [Haemaphysalis longicornis]